MSSQADSTDRARMQEERRVRLNERMAEIKHKLIVLSGKGGVGKSTVAAFLATALASHGQKVGLLDADIHGPSIPKMLGVEDARVGVSAGGMAPVKVADNLSVMSIAFMLRSKRDAVIWRGPLKMGVIEEFLANVEWGPLDYLVIDSPPGTGDEPLSVCQLIPGLDGAIVVATPQAIALADVERSITFCRQVRVPVVGIVENMSGFVCPHCGKTSDVFKSGGAMRLAQHLGVRFLGRLPMVPEVVDACDEGRCMASAIKAETLRRPLGEIVAAILALEPAAVMDARHAGSESTSASDEGSTRRGADRRVGDRERCGSSCSGGDLNSDTDASHASKQARKDRGHRAHAPGTDDKGQSSRPITHGRIALPLEGGRLSSHFGHSSQFVIFDVEGGEIAGQEVVTPPPHAPGVIPSWLKDLEVTIVIAGGLGRRAMATFEQVGITAVCGAPPEDPREVVKAYLKGALPIGENVCDH